MQCSGSLAWRLRVRGEAVLREGTLVREEAIARAKLAAQLDGHVHGLEDAAMRTQSCFADKALVTHSAVKVRVDLAARALLLLLARRELSASRRLSLRTRQAANVHKTNAAVL